MPRWPEWFSDRQRTQLVGFQGNLLRKHHVAGNKLLIGHKTPAGFRTSVLVEFVDICHQAISDSISLTRYTADDFEIAVPLELNKLLRR